MDDEVKLFIAAIVSTACVVISLIWAIAWCNVVSFRDAIEAGYHQQTLQGQGGVYWVKQEEDNGTDN